MLTSWLWIELRRKFLWMLAASIAMSFLCAASYEWGSTPESLAYHVGAWNSNLSGNVYLASVVLLTWSGITACSGSGRQVLQSLPITGRGWVESQWRVVGALSVILALVSHGAVTIFAWGFSGELVPLRQSMIHAARWVVCAWLFFGFTASVGADSSRGRGCGAALLLFAPTACRVGPWDAIEWGPSQTGSLTGLENLAPLIVVVIVGWIGAGVAARRIDRGE